MCLCLQVTFEGLWSRHTHPKDFPSNSWSTKFSDVIGASHTTKYRYTCMYLLPEADT